MNETDIYIKDKGKFHTVILLTERAKSKAKEGGINMKLADRFDIKAGQQNAVIMWATTHRLKVKSEIPITITTLN